MLLRDGFRGYGWHSKQLCEGRLESLGLDGEHPSLACVLLVPHLQHSHKSADEQDRPQEHGAFEPRNDFGRNGSIDVYHLLPDVVARLLPFRNRQCHHADLAQSVG